MQLIRSWAHHRTGGRARLLVAAAAVFSLAAFAGFGLGPLVPGPSQARAVACGQAQKRWNFAQSTTAAYGIDGYITRPATNQLSDPTCNFLAHFIGLAGVYPDGSGGVIDSGQWVQVGLTIGFLPPPPDGPGGSATTYVVYTDGINDCLTYDLKTHGAPSAVNAAYYINYTGVSGFDTICATNWYQYAIRKGSFGSQPFYYRYMGTANGIWVAENEVLKQGIVWEYTGPVRWGHDAAGGTPAGYGMAWYNVTGGTWNEWAPLSFGTGPIVDSDPFGQPAQYKYCRTLSASWRAGKAVRIGDSC